MTPKPTFLKGTLSISRISGGGEADEIRVTVRDESSGIEFVEARMSLEQFAQTMFGSRESECSFTLRGVDLVGSIAENKTELVPYDLFKDRSEKAQAKALKPFEVDGWVARGTDISNNHYRTEVGGKPHQAVVFFRHVTKEGKPL